MPTYVLHLHMDADGTGASKELSNTFKFNNLETIHINYDSLNVATTTDEHRKAAEPCRQVLRRELARLPVLLPALAIAFRYKLIRLLWYANV